MIIHYEKRFFLNLLLFIHLFINLLACLNADTKRRPEMSDVIKFLDKIDINDTVQMYK